MKKTTIFFLAIFILCKSYPMKKQTVLEALAREVSEREKKKLREKKASLAEILSLKKTPHKKRTWADYNLLYTLKKFNDSSRYKIALIPWVIKQIRKVDQALKDGADPELLLKSNKDSLQLTETITPLFYIFDYYYQRAKKEDAFLSSEETLYKPEYYLSPKDALHMWLKMFKNSGVDLNQILQIKPAKDKQAISVTLCDVLEHVDYNWYLFFRSKLELKSIKELK